MPVTARKKKNSAAVTAAMLELEGLAPAEAKAMAKQITLKSKVPELLKQAPVPDDRSAIPLSIEYAGMLCYQLWLRWQMACCPWGRH